MMPLTLDGVLYIIIVLFVKMFVLLVKMPEIGKSKQANPSREPGMVEAGQVSLLKITREVPAESPQRQ